jgi:hypothetical protein
VVAPPTVARASNYQLLLTLTGQVAALDLVGLDAAVPEPSAWGLFGIGLLGVWASRRKRV